MKEKLYNVVAVKERLDAYREEEREIDNQIERIERIETKMIGVGAQVITDMPRSPSVSNDRITDLLNQKLEFEDFIRDAIMDHNDEKSRIEEIIRHLHSSDERAVIRMRYFDGASWNEVNKMMFSWKDDFEDRKDSFLRRIYKLHGSALLNMAKYIEETESQNTEVPADM